ncbi:hypothetical protein [Micromonospora sp. NPDC005197]|uniref:hypothetical protein n=1 Tax=Micromonospora sp. NPDC005197 TaxID=3157020 RepID=UPI0033ABA840
MDAYHYGDDMSPAARSAAWAIETWLTDLETFRWLIGRFTEGPELFDAYLSTLDTLDYDADPVLLTGAPGGMFAETQMIGARVAVKRGPAVGEIMPAGRKTFAAVARDYLMSAVVHGKRGWMGVHLWRGAPIYTDRTRRERLIMRDRTYTRPGDRPMWERW